MAIQPFLHLPPPPPTQSVSELAAYLRRLYDALRPLRMGKTENVGEVTLTANAASSTISDIRISKQSVISFLPRTANAAAELANGTMYILKANQTTGSAVVTHANNAQTDREFLYSVVG